MTLKELAHMPKKFYLDSPGADDTMVSIAAGLAITTETDRYTNAGFSCGCYLRLRTLCHVC